MDKIRIGTRIKYFRELNNISQSDLAHSIGVDRTTLSHYESGFRLPNIFVLWKIADVMRISVGWEKVGIYVLIEICHIMLYNYWYKLPMIGEEQ